MNASAPQAISMHLYTTSVVVVAMSRYFFAIAEPPSPYKSGRFVKAEILLHRDRLLLAFANLAGYGICARPSFAPDAQTGHLALNREMRLRRPQGHCAYVFYIEPAERLFTADGSLGGALTLHYQGEAVDQAIRAACSEVGLDTLGPAGAGMLIVPVALQAGAR